MTAALSDLRGHRLPSSLLCAAALASGLLLAAGSARAQQDDPNAGGDAPNADSIDAVRQMLQQGGTLPPEAQQYLQAHPELKEQLIEGAKKKVDDENKDRPRSNNNSKYSSTKNAEPEPPFIAPYDWRNSIYLKNLFGNRLTPSEKATVVHFGHDLFQPRYGNSSALEDMPVSPTYIVGPGDQVIVKTWGRLEGSNRLTVDREGNIFYPKIGSIAVAGKTFEEVRALINDTVGKIAEVQSEVSLGDMKATRVSVVGEVRSPGWLNVSSLHTALQALYLAGGVKDIGSMRRIELRRGGKVAAKIDLYDFLQHGDSHSDIRLQPADTIFVPVVGKVIAVVGDVRRPAIYELAEEKTLAAAMELSGGFGPSAFTKRIQVERLDEHNSSIVLDIDTAALKSKPGTFELKDGDIVRVFPIVDADENVITLEGNVRRPGRYQVKPGMKVSDLLPDAKAFLPETWFDYARLTRLVPPDLHKELIAVNLRQLILDKSGTDIPLQGRDTLTVFPRTDFKDLRRVKISGEVRDVVRAEKAAAMAEAAKQESYQNYQPALERRDNGYDRLARTFSRSDRTREFGQIRNEENRDRSDTSDNSTREEHDGGSPDREDDRSANDDRDYERQGGRDNGNRNMSRRRSNDEEKSGFARDDGNPNNDNQLDESKPGQMGAPTSASFISLEIAEGERVSDAILSAGGLTKNALMTRAEIVRIDPAHNHQTIYFDLAKALEGDADANILLEDDDRIRIHSIWETKQRQKVFSSGELKNPGMFTLTDGMRLSDLIFKAGGLLPSAYGAEGELVRREVTPDGELLRTLTIKVQLAKALAGDAAANVLLQENDQLVVRQVPDWTERIQVRLSGEVRFPGLYAAKKGERLSTVIARAGGFTGEAYLHAARFTRESTRASQQAAIDRLIDELQLAAAQKAQSADVLDKEEMEFDRQAMLARQSLINQLKKAKANGRVIIHLPDDSSLEGSPSDVLLENWDSLEIPKKMNVVTVVGRVYNPTGIVLDPENLKAGHYLDMVGGPTESADTGHIFLLRADGSVATEGGVFGASVESRRVAPGDSIIVPEKLTQSRFLRDLRDITQIMMQIAITADVLLRI